MPADEYKQDESYCDVPCVGDSDVQCGGSGNAINVYEIDGAAGTISTTESMAGSTQEPTIPTTEDVVTYSTGVCMREIFLEKFYFLSLGMNLQAQSYFNSMIQIL